MDSFYDNFIDSGLVDISILQCLNNIPLHTFMLKQCCLFYNALRMVSLLISAYCLRQIS